jgi:hypothetical protein
LSRALEFEKDEHSARLPAELPFSLLKSQVKCYSARDLIEDIMALMMPKKHGLRKLA